MCQAGDIILVNKYSHNGIVLDKHSFVVISDEGGKIQGLDLDYDIICNVMSSFKSEEHKKSILHKYKGTFPVTYNDSVVKNGNKQDGFIKAEQFYYFNKEKIDYCVIGFVKEDIYEALLEFIENLSIPSVHILDNL